MYQLDEGEGGGGRRLNGPCIYVYVSAESLFLSPRCLPFVAQPHSRSPCFLAPWFDPPRSFLLPSFSIIPENRMGKMPRIINFNYSLAM